VAIGPEAGGNSWYHGKAEEQVLESVEQARKYLNIDTRRLYLVGRSMGGAGALTIAMHHPDRVAGVVSLAGVSDYPAICKTNSYMLGNDAGSVRTRFGGTPDEKPEVYRQMSAVNYAEVLKTIPVFLIHGATDGVVPVYHSRALAEKLQKAGGKVVFKEVPNEGHNMEMIEWFTADYFKFLEGNPPARK
jgi:dipeptidyl aminopeptidase/acylaminoacyl peptidase